MPVVRRAGCCPVECNWKASATQSRSLYGAEAFRLRGWEGVHCHGAIKIVPGIFATRTLNRFHPVHNGRPIPAGLRQKTGRWLAAYRAGPRTPVDGFVVRVVYYARSGSAAQIQHSVTAVEDQSCRRCTVSKYDNNKNYILDRLHVRWTRRRDAFAVTLVRESDTDGVCRRSQLPQQ